METPAQLGIRDMTEAAIDNLAMLRTWLCEENQAEAYKRVSEAMTALKEVVHTTHKPQWIH